MHKGAKLLKANVVQKRRRNLRLKNAAMNTLAYQYIALAALILAGIVIGAVMARNNSTGSRLDFGVFMQNTLSKESINKGFGYLFLTSFFSSSLLLCSAFILGLCAIGSPGHVAVLLFKGAGIGLSMGYIYIQYGLKGLGICAVFILPQSILLSLALIIACREGMKFTFEIASVILRPDKARSLWTEFCGYCYKYVCCFALIAAASLIEALCAIGFSGLFFS